MQKLKSSAVMNSRIEPHDGLDDFPTPPWAGRALMKYVFGENDLFNPYDIIWEPAANRGFLFKGLRDFNKKILLSDIHDYGVFENFTTHDFLMPYLPFDGIKSVDWVITNPPFNHCAVR